MEIDAEAEAERYRRMAKGEADAIFAKMEAQARGINEMLGKQALGFKQIIGASGGDTDAAVRMMIADKLEDIVKVQVEAIKNLKIDKVTVWDGGSASGQSSTAGFLSGLMKSIPPMNELFDMAGMELPSYLGKDKNIETAVSAENAQPVAVPTEAVPVDEAAPDKEK